MVTGNLLSEVTRISEAQWLRWILEDPVVPLLVLCGADLVRWYDADGIFARLRQCGPADAFQRWCVWSRASSPGQPRRRTVTDAVKKEVAARQEWKCRRCGELLTASFECDHLEEHAIRGNDDASSNLQCLCARCHRVKTREDRTYAEPLLATAPGKKVVQYEGSDGHMFSAYFHRTCN